jgi:hypothetical protein
MADAERIINMILGKGTTKVPDTSKILGKKGKEGKKKKEVEVEEEDEED